MKLRNLAEAGLSEEAVAAFRSLTDHEGAVRAARLGGLTNRVYRVETDDGIFVVRLPGEGTEAYIDRQVEAANTQAAARAGVSPELVKADPLSGLMLTRFAEGRTMTADLFKTLPGAPSRAALALRKLHSSGETFQFRFELFAMIESYMKLLGESGADLPDGYHEALAQAEDVLAALDAHPATLAPCHCDPLCENFIDDGARMWMVDWEYSGMNDPLWDLGDLSVEGAFGPREESEMLRAYFGRAPTAAEEGRVVLYKAMCDLLWTLWGLIQHANNNPADDFWGYATGRFERCKALMQSDGFEACVEAVRSGQ